MSLFICDECGCVENTNCNHPPYDMVGIDPEFPNMHSMEMAGFNDEYKETGIRQKSALLCSECNTGTWHGEFPKEQATEIEIIMGQQLEGDERNIFTFHPLWRAYSSNPAGFNKELLNKDVFAETKQFTHRTMRNWREPIEPFVRGHEKISRNAKCPCNSGKKFKKCCGQK